MGGLKIIGNCKSNELFNKIMMIRKMFPDTLIRAVIVLIQLNMLSN